MLRSHVQLNTTYFILGPVPNGTLNTRSNATLTVGRKSAVELASVQNCTSRAHIDHTSTLLKPQMTNRTPYGLVDFVITRTRLPL